MTTALCHVGLPACRPVRHALQEDFIMTIAPCRADAAACLPVHHAMPEIA